MPKRSVVLTLIALLAGCESRTYGAPPPPPPAPPPAPAQPAPEPEAPTAAPEPVSGKRAAKGKKARDHEPSAPAAAPSKPAPPTSTTPAPAPPVEKAPAPKSAVRVPSSDHVNIELPAGLQADLDHDPRMQPWVTKAVSAIERCYAPLRDAGASGVIEVRLVMHENERPSAEPGKFPSALTSMLACVTGDLMRVKMPLFTGKEGTRYTLKIRLSK